MSATTIPAPKTQHRTIGGRAFAGCLLLGTMLACGPVTSHSVRWSRAPADANEYKQTKDGLTVEMQDVDTSAPLRMPPSLVANVPVCGSNGLPQAGADGKTETKLAPIMAPGQVWIQVAVTNNTDHVVRLNGVVIKLFDPAGNQVDPLQKSDIMSLGVRTRPTGGCAMPSSSVNEQLQLVKLLDRNVEIIPNTTVTAFLAFKPPSAEIPGMWKLAIYEVPVLTDDAGKVSKTTRFELRTSVKKMVDTYQQDNPFSQKQLIDSKEETN